MGRVLKKLKYFWDCRTFASQLTAVFLVVFFVLVIILGGTGTYLFRQILESKIEESFRQTLRQTGKNIDTTLSIYKDSISQLAIDRDLLWNLKNLDLTQKADIREQAEEQLEDRLMDYMAYQSDVRFVSVETADGVIYSFDRTQNRSIYRNVSELHKTYFDQGLVEARQGVKGIWMRTEYLDRVGTREYYVYTFGKQIYDWNINRYLGSLLVSIEEDRLADICGEAQISKDQNINSLFIVDSGQRIVSHSDKSLIGKKMYEAINFDGMKVFEETLPSSGWTVVSLLNQGYIYNQVRDVQRMVLLSCAMLGIVAVVMIAFVSRRMTRYVKNIVSTMREVESGRLSATVGVNRDEKNELNLIAVHFNAMMDKINEQVKMVKIAGEKEKEAEIRALEAQINPHFIYNTLDSINWLAIENGQDEISSMLSQFAQILRYQIQKSNGIVTIEEELGYLEKYLFLQKKRFMDSFEYLIECQETVKSCRIHKMIFQPLIENSILHGCAKLDYGGFLKIQIQELDETHLKFMIVDNGAGMEPEQARRLFSEGGSGGSIGIANVLARLKVYYGEYYSMHVDSMPGAGTSIEVVIPKQDGSGDRDENTDC